MGLVLPEDVLSKILASLPVISVLRFKSVCKSWRSLIQSSFFIDLHIATSSSSKFGSFIFHTYVTGSHSYVGRGSHSYLGRSKENAVLMLSSSGSETESESESESVFKVVDDNSYEDQNHHLVFKLDNLGIPSPYQFFTKWSDPKYIVGSCNGLICLYDFEDKDISLWNPATRQFRILPKSIKIEKYGSFVHIFGSVAFGFDVETKDYKVVLLTCYDDHMSVCHCQVQVYNLSSDSWRLLEGINSLHASPHEEHDQCHGLSEGLYLNGSCYFMAMDKNSSWMIISFNLTKEIFTAIQLPEDHDVRRHRIFLSSLGEKLAFFKECKCNDAYVAVHWEDEADCPYDNEDYVFNEVEHVDLEIWVLNEEHKEEEESWRKFHSFRIEVSFGCEWIPRGISNNGEFALFEFRDPRIIETSKKMKLYNLVTKEAKKDFLSCTRVMSRAIFHQPSVVSVIGEKLKSQKPKAKEAQSSKAKEAQKPSSKGS